MTAIPTWDQALFQGGFAGRGEWEKEDNSVLSLSDATHPHDLSKICVLGHEWEVHEALDEEGKGDEVEKNLYEIC